VYPRESPDCMRRQRCTKNKKNYICRLAMPALRLTRSPIVRKIIRSMNVDFWNQRYSEQGWAYGLNPNDFFRRWLAYHQPGRLLLPCEGEGRQALHAARLGWQVEAFDQSEAGKNKALEQARLENLSVDYRIMDALNYQSEPVHDGLALIYAHFPVDIRLRVHRNLGAALRPGGWVLVEGFHTNQVGKPSGGPQQQPDMLFEPHQLEGDFEGFEVLLSQVLDIRLGEGKYHQGEASVCRFIARKPVVNSQ
jgi:hypothetical protein